MLMLNKTVLQLPQLTIQKLPVWLISAACLLGCQQLGPMPLDAPEAQHAVPIVELTSYQDNQEFIAQLYEQTGQRIELNLKGHWPYVSYDRGTCGPVFWEVAPEDNTDLFISGTQLCFENDNGTFYSEFADDNRLSRSLYQLTSDEKAIYLKGRFQVVGEIDRGRFGVWTIGLKPLEPSIP